MKPSQELEKLFLALADQTRLRLLNLMATGEICVCYFVEVLDEPQPKISRHLAYLRKSGLVDARREGKWMHYGLRPQTSPAVIEILEKTLSLVADDRTMQRDRAALLSACCATKLPVTLRNAPKPELRVEN